MRRDKRSENGFVSIETALVFPFFLIVLLLLTQFIFLIFAKRAAQTAAEQGAEEAAYYQSNDAAGLLAAQDAASQIPGLKNPAASVQRSSNDVTVTVTGKPIRILPIPMDVSAQSSAPIERIIEAGDRQ